MQQSYYNNNNLTYKNKPHYNNNPDYAKIKKLKVYKSILKTLNNFTLKTVDACQKKKQSGSQPKYLLIFIYTKISYFVRELRK